MLLFPYDIWLTFTRESANNAIKSFAIAHSDASQLCCSAPLIAALACYFIKVCLLRWGREMRRNMEEFQEIAKSQKMGVVVLQRIVRNYRVHGRMVSNAKGTAVFKTSVRGTSIRPKNWDFVARKWQENEDFFKSAVTQTRCILVPLMNRCMEKRLNSWKAWVSSDT